MANISYDYKRVKDTIEYNRTGRGIVIHIKITVTETGIITPIYLEDLLPDSVNWREYQYGYLWLRVTPNMSYSDETAKIYIYKWPYKLGTDENGAYENKLLVAATDSYGMYKNGLGVGESDNLLRTRNLYFYIFQTGSNPDYSYYFHFIFWNNSR